MSADDLPLRQFSNNNLNGAVMNAVIAPKNPLPSAVTSSSLPAAPWRGNDVLTMPEELAAPRIYDVGEKVVSRPLGA
jgi:hypothetical protein